MKIAYFDCYSGISGDMCLGALIDAGASVEEIKRGLRTLPVTGWELNTARVERGGVSATKADVACTEPSGQHRNLPDVLGILEAGALPERAAVAAARAFRLLAEAEAYVHNCPVEDVHFHEVGGLDAIIDIAGVSLAFCLLGIEKAFVSPVAVGGGEVSARHGRLPVPAPATAKLLEGFEIYGGPVQKELSTPTGAALLRCLAESVSMAPAMSLKKTGYGAGDADFGDRSNTLRVILGESTGRTEPLYEEIIWIIEANIDDMTGEEMGFLMEESLSEGALDAFITPVQMKKNRPAFKFTILSTSASRDSMIEFLLSRSSTLGVRYQPMSRRKIDRRKTKVSTRWGEVNVKLGIKDGNVISVKPEFEDCSRIASEEGIELRRVRDAAVEAWENSTEKRSD